MQFFLMNFSWLSLLLLVFVSFSFCQISNEEELINPFYWSRITSHNDTIASFETYIDDAMFKAIVTTPLLHKIYSYRFIIPTISLAALAILHKADLDERISGSPRPSVTTSIIAVRQYFYKQSFLWVVIRPFGIALAVLVLQKIFLYSILYYPRTSSIRSMIEIIDPLLMRPDQYLCYIMGYSISQSLFSTFKINTFADYLLACSLWLVVRRLFRDIYLFLPKTLYGVSIILALSFATSWVYACGGPSSFFTLIAKSKKSSGFSLLIPSGNDNIGDIVAALVKLFELSVTLLFLFANLIHIQLLVGVYLAWYLLCGYADPNPKSADAPLVLWKLVSFFKEDIKISLPFYIVKWTKLLPLYLTSTTLPVVSTIGEALFFLIVYLCIGLVDHSEKILNRKADYRIVPLGV